MALNIGVPLSMTPPSLHRLSFSRAETFGASFSLPPLSISTSPQPLSVTCGRGDKKTAKGKRFNGSYGNARPRNKNKGRGPPRTAVPPLPLKKDKFDDGSIVKIEIDESLFSN